MKLNIKKDPLRYFSRTLRQSFQSSGAHQGAIRSWSPWQPLSQHTIFLDHTHASCAYLCEHRTTVPAGVYITLENQCYCWGKQEIVNQVLYLSWAKFPDLLSTNLKVQRVRSVVFLSQQNTSKAKTKLQIRLTVSQNSQLKV